MNLKTDIQDSIPMQERIIGKWQWIETVVSSRGGGSRSNPESCNCQKVLELTDDGYMRQYENGELVIDTLYTVEEFKFLNDPVRYRFKGGPIWGDIQFINDKLGLGSFGTCGAIHYYRKLESK